MIALKGMEMPKCCIRCPVFDGEYGLCNIIGDEPKADLAKERPEDCPLVEIITCEDCDHCRFELVEGIPYYWCDKDDRVTSEDYYCADGERRK